MAPRVIKLREHGELGQETEPELFPQRKRPELGRYLLQVDRQTKGYMKLQKPLKQRES